MQTLRCPPGEDHFALCQPPLQVVPVTGQTVDRGDGSLHRHACRFPRQQALLDRLEQLVDVDELGRGTGANDEVEVMVLGLPDVTVDRDRADVEVEVLLAFVAGIERW
jgi:hypothetical protein